MKIILFSGSIGEKIMNNSEQYGVGAVLRKPFKMNYLRSKLLAVNKK